jgi:drug/metabolite transporter (DMT)-like permease
MISTKVLSSLSSYGGVIFLVAFGYFATVEGIQSAFHGPAILLAVGALVLGSVYANTRPRNSPGQESSNAAYRNLSTILSIAAAILFFFEVNISIFQWREILGSLSLILYVLSFIIGVAGRHVRAK